MQPVMILVILILAVAAMGAGFLNNAISLNVQQLGVGEADLTSPVETANIDLQIQRFDIKNGNGKVIGFQNVINACSFHSDDSMPGESTIFCKLTNKDGLVVAEGNKTVTDYVGSTTPSISIVIDTKAFSGANDVKNIHDVTIVVLGDNPTP